MQRNDFHSSAVRYGMLHKMVYMIYSNIFEQLLDMKISQIYWQYVLPDKWGMSNCGLNWNHSRNT